MQQANETAGARCVGLSLETRPDRVDAAEVVRLRRLGATKVQIGVQSLDDTGLSANRHGLTWRRRAAPSACCAPPLQAAGALDAQPAGRHPGR